MEPCLIVMTQSIAAMAAKPAAHGWVVSMGGKRHGAMMTASGTCTVIN